MKTGILLLLTAEMLFALSTVFVKFVTNDTAITGIELSFFRFFTGLVLISAYSVVRSRNIKPVKPFNIYMRGIFNTASVIFFFLGVQYSTVGKTNLLNMTYPVFVFILSPYITKEKTPRDFYIFLILVIAGIYLVAFSPGSGSDSISIGDFFGLMSGITAGFGISFLREARKTDAIHTILIYMFAIGSAISGLMLINSFIIPSGIYIFHIFIVAIFSFIGQVLITAGYKCVSASAGSLISSARIIFAIILGVVFFSEPLTVRIFAGSLLIMVSLAGVNGLFRNLKTHKKR